MATSLTKCHICGCTYERACDGGCAWEHRPGELPICSLCAELGAAIGRYAESAYRVSGLSLGRLLTLAMGATGAVGRRMDSGKYRAPGGGK